jgi:hypothetical protein
LAIPQIAMAMDILMPILNEEKIIEGCPDAREAVARTCLAFRQSVRFPKPISNQKIAELLGVDPETVSMNGLQKYF